MDKRHLSAAATRFQLKDPGLYRVATAAGQQYVAGYVDRRDWAGVPVGALVFARLGRGGEGPLLAGHVVANTLIAGYQPEEENGLTLRLCLPGAVVEPEHFPQRLVATLFLALEQLNKPAL